MMKIPGFWILLLVGSTCLMLLNFSSNASSITDIRLASNDLFSSESITTSRKLKETAYDSKSVNLEDYHPYDPVPSSTASLRPGPIEHSTPLNPFIPKPPPPPPPKRGKPT